MSARFEIVRTDAEQPWHARIVASNGRVLFSSENYGRRRDALSAVAAALGAAGVMVNRPPTPDAIPDRYIGVPLFSDTEVSFEVRAVDERSGS